MILKLKIQGPTISISAAPPLNQEDYSNNEMTESTLIVPDESQIKFANS